MRKEFNYPPKENTSFVTLSSVNKVDLNTGSCWFNREEIASVMSHALKSVYLYI